MPAGIVGAGGSDKKKKKKKKDKKDDKDDKEEDEEDGGEDGEEGGDEGGGAAIGDLEIDGDAALAVLMSGEWGRRQTVAQIPWQCRRCACCQRASSPCLAVCKHRCVRWPPTSPQAPSPSLLSRRAWL